MWWPLRLLGTAAIPISYLKIAPLRLGKDAGSPPTRAASIDQQQKRAKRGDRRQDDLEYDHAPTVRSLGHHLLIVTEVAISG